MKRLVTAACMLVSPLALAHEQSTPNIVLIVVDDLGARDIGCEGCDLARTPAIDALALRGVRFTQAYAAGCVCSPTRASIMTGQTPARTGITDWIPGARLKDMPMQEPAIPNALDAHVTTLAEALRNAGYSTFHVGKWHLGGAGSLPTDHGFDVNVGGDMNGHPASYFFPYDGGNAANAWRVRPWPSRPLVAAHTTDEYLTDRLTDEAIALIDQAVAEHRPFFLSMQHYGVHSPLQAPRDEVAAYQQLLADDPTVARTHRNPTYAAMTAEIDQSVARIVAELERVGAATNTVLIFTSDNGGEESATSNLPLRSAKGRLYEGGIRVPLIVAGKGVAAGEACSAPVVSTDLFPTILDLAHAKAPPEQASDGRSFVRLLADPDAVESARMLAWHYPHYHTKERRPMSAIRVGDFKLVFYWDTRESELFDLSTDPGEARSIASNNLAKAEELRAALGAWLKETGAKVPIAVDAR